MTDDEDHETPASACPGCGYVVDRAMDIGPEASHAPATPKPGDFTVCLNCGRFLQFDDKLQLATANLDAWSKELTSAQRRVLWNARTAILRRGLIHERQGAA